MNKLTLVTAIPAGRAGSFRPKRRPGPGRLLKPLSDSVDQLIRAITAANATAP